MLVPWNSGCSLLWDATCPDTFAASYRVQATVKAGRVAAQAKESKSVKYALLAILHLIPIAIETSGLVGPSTLKFLADLRKRISIAKSNYLIHLYIQFQSFVKVFSLLLH